MKYIPLILSFLFVFSCKEKDETLELKYEVLNRVIEENIKIHKQAEEHLGIIDSTDFFVMDYNFKILDEKDWSKYSDSVKKENSEIRIIVEPENSIVLMSDSIFTKQDIQFIKQQTKENYHFKLDSKRIKEKVKFISQEELDGFLSKRKKSVGKNYVKLAVPFFNMKKDKCLMKANDCGIYPPGCGGSVFILQKKNGKWELLKTLKRWVN